MLFLPFLLFASFSPSYSSSASEECATNFSFGTLSRPTSVSPLECPSLKALLLFSDVRHSNVSSLRLNCEWREEMQEEVFQKLLNVQAFRTLKTLFLLNCGPFSARFSQLPQLEELDYGKSELTHLDWQSIGSKHLRKLNIGRLSAIGGCEKCQNAWLTEQQKVSWPNPIFPQLPEHIALTAPLPPNCSFAHCPNENVRFEQAIVHSRLGSSLHLRCHFQTHNALAKDRFKSSEVSATNAQNVFVWPFSNYENERRWEERETGEDSMQLVVPSLNRHHLGNVACRCWHCDSPRFDVAQIRFWTPLSVGINMSTVYDQRGVEQSHTFLLVHGYPLDTLRLGIRLMPNNLTEWHDFSVNEAHTFSNDSLLVRSEVDHSHFFLRYFSIHIHECSDCWHSQMGGAFEIEVCREKGEGEQSERPANGLTTGEECADSVKGQLWPTKHPKSNGTNDTGARHSSTVILGSLFITLFFILLILLLSLLGITAKGKRMEMKGWAISGNTQFTEETSIPLYALSHCPPFPQHRHKLTVIDSQNLKLHQRIGKGAFGAVYEAIWTENGQMEEGELGTNEKEEQIAEHGKAAENARKVAIKFLTNVNFDAMDKEATLLARLDHPNVLRMFGISYLRGQIALVLELMNCGDLRSYIQERVPSQGEYARFPPALNNLELIGISIQIAEGLCYLVRSQVVHRDLAARNCLVSGDSDHRCKNATQRPPICVKISDFGMSRCLYSSMEYYKMRSKSAVPIRWTAPECLSNGKYTHQSDIWSFGVLLFEIFSYGETPFGAFISNGKVNNALKNGGTPNVPEGCSTEMAELMRKCWDRMADKRISAEEALQTLKVIRREEEGKAAESVPAAKDI